MSLLLATLERTDGGIRLAVFASVLLPAVWLASRQSTFLVDYYMVVVCLNRFIRRLLDWADGTFDSLPILSLLPATVSLLLMSVVVKNYARMPTPLQNSLRLIFVALAYGLALGLRNGLGAFFDLLGYVMPISMLFYGIAVRVDLPAVERWVRTLTCLAIGVAVYGWFQWVFAPEWDTAWLIWSGMITMGKPEPFMMSVFSTLESRGPFATLMAISIPPLVACTRWRPAGWPGVFVVVAASVLSMVRTGWAMSFLGLAIYGAVRGGQSMVKIALATAVCMVALMNGLKYLPESEKFISRIESIGELQSDNSFRARNDIAAYGIGLVLTQPQGFGLGSTGLAGRVGGASVIGDNGLLELLATFGLPGATLLAIGLAGVVRSVLCVYRVDRQDIASLSLAQFAAGICSLAITNWLSGPYSGMVLMTLGGVVGAELRSRGSASKGLLPTPTVAASCSAPYSC